jgi:outer membrane protein OmpA-like peptidoglycan-associated protein
MQKRLLSQLRLLCLPLLIAADPARAATDPPNAAAAAASSDAPSSKSSRASEPADSQGERNSVSERADSLLEQSSVSGGTGLLHLEDPRASAWGSFRVSLLLDFYKGSGFLCNSSTPCPNSQKDSASHFGTTFNLSVPLLGFLEAYARLGSFANANDARTPSLISAVANTTFALKGFTPAPIADVFRFGGAVETDFLGSSGSVGVSGSGTSFRLLGLAEADFRGHDRQGLPLRAHLNVGYFFDNSGALAKAAEVERGTRITRIERFGLDINRVDQFQLGLGVDGIFGPVRPFVEWNLGAPVNRQGYVCYPAIAFPGDGCLATDKRFSAFPSALTLGARVFPWLTGLSATAAFDIGTSGTSNFIEELAPTMPWTLWLGVGYGFDTTPPPAPAPPPVEKIVIAPRPPELRLRGFVHEEDKSDGVAKAVVLYDGRDFTGMVTGSDGHFVSQSLEPGTYTLRVEAPGFEPATCMATIPATTAPKDSEQPTPSATPASNPAPVPAKPVENAPTPPSYFDVDCPLHAIPPLATLTGQVRDAADLNSVNGASVTLRDPLGREVTLTTDANGSFHVDHVPPGTLTLIVEANGYLSHAEPAEVAPRAAMQLNVAVRRRPKTSNVTKVRNELVLRQPIRFAADASDPAPESLPLLEEVADWMLHAPSSHVEIQAYTDASGDAGRDEALTERRAGAVRDWLVAHGVDTSHLSTRGFGSAKPISPNVTAAGRARNRRVKFVLGE